MEYTKLCLNEVKNFTIRLFKYQTDCLKCMEIFKPWINMPLGNVLKANEAGQNFEIPLNKQ